MEDEDKHGMSLFAPLVVSLSEQVRENTMTSLGADVTGSDLRRG